MKSYKEWYIDADGEVISIAETPEDKIIGVYSSIGDLYKIIYNLAMEYQTESDERKRVEIENRLRVASTAINALSASSKNVEKASGETKKRRKPETFFGIILKYLERHCKEDAKKNIRGKVRYSQ